MLTQSSVKVKFCGAKKGIWFQLIVGKVCLLGDFSALVGDMSISGLAHKYEKAAVTEIEQWAVDMNMHVEFAL